MPLALTILHDDFTTPSLPSLLLLRISIYTNNDVSTPPSSSSTKCHTPDHTPTRKWIGLISFPNCYAHDIHETPYKNWVSCILETKNLLLPFYIPATYRVTDMVSSPSLLSLSITHEISSHSQCDHCQVRLAKRISLTRAMHRPFLSHPILNPKHSSKFGWSTTQILSVGKISKSDACDNMRYLRVPERDLISQETHSKH